MISCPFGGDCIDPGYPSEAEKAEFDSLPDRYEIERDGKIVKFKNRTQVKFFLLDVQNPEEYKIYFVQDNGTRIQAQL